MSVWSIRRVHDMKLMYLVDTKKNALMQLERRVADGRLPGKAEDYTVRKEED